uniref:Uncharacterized protein n=1 Tax=Archaeoglobus fulgidus TaxID=2234 RepID=A0A7C2S6Y3_ARCFL
MRKLGLVSSRQLEIHLHQSVEDAKTVYSSWLEIVKLYVLDKMKTIAGCIKSGFVFRIGHLSTAYHTSHILKKVVKAEWRFFRRKCQRRTRSST